MTYTHWTNLEIRRMKEMHLVARPSREALYAAFDRHPPGSVYRMACKFGLRAGIKSGSAERFRYWLRIAHEHFARREAGLLA